MKKLISLLLAFTMILSVVSGITVFAREESVLLFEDTFDDNVFDSPAGWETNKYASKSYLQSKLAMEGKALRIVDDSTAENAYFYSKRIPVTPGQMYTAVADAFPTSGILKIFITFYDAEGKQAGGLSSSSLLEGEWNVITSSMVAPENAVTVGISLNSNVKEYLVDGVFDNARIYKGVYRTTKAQTMDPPLQEDPVKSKIIEPVGDKLVYNTYNDLGDKLSDYSYAGFYAGKYELPNSENLTVAATVEPSETPGTDDTLRLQKVIDDVYNNAYNDYFKVIKLKAGQYNINRNGLNLKSGIILSGEGQGPDGTVIFATDPVQYEVIKAKGKAPVKTSQNAYIEDKYVKAGSFEISIDPSRINDYKVGDLIVIYHPTDVEWSKGMEMYGLTNANGVENSWDPGEVDMAIERTVTAIEGNKLVLDMALNVPLDTTLSKCYVYKIDDSSRIEHVGVENLRLVSYYNGDPIDEKHATAAISFSQAKNCYVRDVSARHFVASTVSCGTGAKQITVKNCSYLEPICINSGSRRYPFANSRAQQILVTGCYAYAGRHDYVCSNPTTGPMAFVDNVSDQSNTPSEPHGCWSTGILYDNIFNVGNNTNGSVAVTNRGTQAQGISQGWSGATTIIWNCLAPVLIAQKPPLTYENFMIGQWGFYDDQRAKERKERMYVSISKNCWKTTSSTVMPPEYGETKDGTSFMGNGYKESEFAPVEPRSLYKAQLAERITGSYKNVKPNAPVIVTPRGEEEDILDNNITIEGLFQKGAEKVTIYIDNKAYNAKLDQKEYMFSLAVELSDGTHKIHATQTIDGVESTKCADRFYIVNKQSINTEALSSQYEYNKINQITNDTRVTFDVYQKEAEKEENSKIKVEINGDKLITDVDPVEISGRVLVPMRAIFEYYNAEINWDEATATATATRKGRTVSVTENSTIAKVDGADYILDVPATIINGRFVVPVRFISESFGSTVGWIDARKTVVITHSVRNDMFNEIPIVKLTPSGTNKTGDLPERMLDGDINTTWAVSTENENGAWLIIDAGEVKSIKNLCLTFYQGTSRVYTFDILTSEDGVNYKEIKTKVKSSGKTEDVEEFPINTSARYVKIVGYGYDGGVWNNYGEIGLTENK